MKSVKKIWAETTNKLTGIYDLTEAKGIARLLLEDRFGVDRNAIFTEEQIDINESSLDKLVERLLAHEPIQYVTGIADFYGRKFKLGEGALIPRPETEELVRLIVQENDAEDPKILDVGVGSGCIGITLSLELQCKVFGTDVSSEALRIAKYNAAELGASVHFIQHDILKSDLPEKELDILVSNPPYIPKAESDTMGKNIIGYEPHQALFVSDEDPLVFYKRIAESALDGLKRGGKLYLEINEHFGSQIVQLLQSLGYGEIRLQKDMQGKDRMIRAINSASR